MSTKKIIHLVMAARPNIMKIAPLYHALLAQEWADPKIVHTGQHYDDKMSGVLLRDFGLPEPHHQLHIGSGTHAEQTGKTMMAYEALCLRERPDLCVVAGDVNATIACAMSAKKLDIPVAHLEAGLRSFDRTMPEEINRLATDAICDFHWTPSRDATAQLIKEGADTAKIAEVGNIMIDALCMMQDRIETDDTARRMNLSGDYAVVTIHRAANVDHADAIAKVAAFIEQAAQILPIVFPVHPRTRSKFAPDILQRLNANADIHLCEPLSYIAFMNVLSGARMALTDSGGLQEETTYLGIPCITLRTTTERPITVTECTNVLAGFDTVIATMRATLDKPRPARPSIKGWDGKTAPRIVAAISQILNSNP